MKVENYNVVAVVINGFSKNSENTITFKNQISETLPKDDELDK